MAVEIPVYVDIKGGIDKAVKDIPKEMPKLERAISQNALKLEFEIDKTGAKKSLQNLLTDPNLSMKQLSTALGSIRKEFENVMALNAGKARTPAAVNNLIKAYTALEQRITGVRNASTASAMTVENAIAKVKFKLNELYAKRGRSATRDEFNKTTYDIRRQEERLRQLNAQYEVYRIKSRQATKSATTGFLEVNGTMKNQSVLLGRLTGLMSTYVSVFGLFRFAKQIRDVTGELEYQRVALGRLIQDEAYGAQLFERIKAAAKESPFRIKELVTYTKQLAAYKIEQKDLFDVTKRLADVSAGLGVDMNRIILAYGQVRAASVLRGQELRQFTEAGIPLVELLAEKFSELRKETVSTSEVFKLISARAVPFSMIADIFEDLTDKGGMFYEMQEKQAQTLRGRWEKLKDAYDIALQSIGDTDSFRKANDAVLATLNKLAENLAIIPKLLNAITVSYLGYVTIMKAVNLYNKRYLIQEALIKAGLVARAVLSKKVTAAEALRLIQTKLLAKAEARLAIATTAASKALNKLWISMLKNPITAVLALAGGLIAFLVSFRTKSNEAAEGVVNLDKTIDNLNERMKEANKLDKLIKKYNELATNTKRSEEETSRLEETIRRLNRAFPELSLSVDDDTDRVKENTKAMDENNKKRLETARARAESDLMIAMGNLRQYKADRVPLEKEYQKWAAALKNYDEKMESGELPDISNTKAYRDVLAKATAAEKALDDMDQQIVDTQKDVDTLNNMLFPKEETVKAWKDLLGTMRFSKGGAEVFTEQQFEGWTRLFDVSNDLEKEWKKLKEDIKALKEAMPSEDDANFADWKEDLDIAQDKFEGLVAIMTAFGFKWGKQTITPYQKDSFITIMENRMKFMKDFKKGYDDLSKYLTKQGALGKESGIMLGRGLSLDMPEAEQKRAAEDLSQWYQDQIDAVIAEMKRKGVKGETLTDILSQQIKGDTNRAKMLRDYQALPQSLWDAKTDFDTTEFVKKIEKALKRSEERLKASETARDFFNNILDLTGDEELAHNLTVSVYGTVGSDFKDRLRSELLDALNLEGVKVPPELKDKLTGDIMLLDVDAIRAEMKKLPPEVKDLFEKALAADQQFNRDWLLDFEKTYAKAKTYKQRVDQLTSQKENAIKQAKAMGKTAEEIEAVGAKFDKDIAGVQLEALKDTYTWTKAFEDLEGVSNATLKNLISLIDEYIAKHRSSLEPTQMKELTRAKEQAEAQLLERNSIKGIAGAIKRLNEARGKQISLVFAGRKNEEEFIKAQDDEADAADDLAKSIQKVVSQTQELVSATQDLAEVFATADDAQYLSEQLNNVSKGLGGVGKVAVGIAEFETNPIEGLLHILTGIEEIVASVFSTSYAAKVKRANDEIEEQDRLLEDLEYTYGRLEKAIAKSFGSDYIYNYREQLRILNAEAAAYAEQARLESEKGKKADEAKIEEYEKKEREALDRIAEMRPQLSEFFAGTDITSAAKDFAKAWIDAYRQFGNTTDAMGQKFKDMVDNMIINSLAGQAIQSMLKPLFDAIDAAATSGGKLTAREIASISELASTVVPEINDSMSNLMSQLAHYGLNMRDNASGLTGIARDIQGASESSINGLAAAYNTQNFYISRIDQNVALIVAALTGKSVAGPNGAPAATGTNPYQDQMLEYVGSIPQMRDDIAAIRSLLSRVIIPKGITATHAVATRL